MAKDKGVPSQDYVPCQYKRPLPGLDMSGTSKPIKARMGGNNASLKDMEHPVMSVENFDEQTPQLCHYSTTNGKKK